MSMRDTVRAGRLHRPFRLAVAVVEVVVAVVVVAVAVAFFDRGRVATDTTGTLLTRIDGRWWGLAALGVVIAGFLVVDAVREVILAVRVGADDTREADVTVAGPPRTGTETPVAGTLDR